MGGDLGVFGICGPVFLPRPSLARWLLRCFFACLGGLVTVGFVGFVEFAGLVEFAWGGGSAYLGLLLCFCFFLGGSFGRSHQSYLLSLWSVMGLGFLDRMGSARRRFASLVLFIIPLSHRPHPPHFSSFWILSGFFGILSTFLSMPFCLHFFLLAILPSLPSSGLRHTLVWKG